MNSIFGRAKYLRLLFTKFKKKIATAGFGMSFSAWNEGEIKGAILGYFDLLNAQERGQLIVKSAVYKRLADEFPQRSAKAFQWTRGRLCINNKTGSPIGAFHVSYQTIWVRI